MIFADESGFSLHPKLGRVWANRGSRPTVPTTSQHRKRLNLFGWVEPLKGWHALFRWPKGNTDGFLAFLTYLYQRVHKTKSGCHPLAGRSNLLLRVVGIC